MISNEKSLNYKVLYLTEYYNFGLGCISIWGHLKDSKNLKFKF